MGYATGPGPVAEAVSDSLPQELKNSAITKKYDSTPGMSMSTCLSLCLETHQQGQLQTEDVLMQCSSCCLDKKIPC